MTNETICVYPPWLEERMRKHAAWQKRAAALYCRQVVREVLDQRDDAPRVKRYRTSDPPWLHVVKRQLGIGVEVPAQTERITCACGKKLGHYGRCPGPLSAETLRKFRQTMADGRRKR